MKEIIVNQYIGLIKNLIASHIPAEIKLVDDVNEYLKSIGMEPNHSLPIAQSLWNSATEPNLVIIKNLITENDRNCVVSKINGNYEAKRKLQDPLCFLKHTVLHEVAHIKHNWKQAEEGKCDEWAFQQLELIN